MRTFRMAASHKAFRIAARMFHAYDPRTVSNGWRQSMLVRLILFLALLLQASGVSPVAAHAQLQYSPFEAFVCKGDASPAAPHSPRDHDGSCSECFTCCDAQPPVLCVSQPAARLAAAAAQSVHLPDPPLPARRTHSATPPARASPL